MISKRKTFLIFLLMVWLVAICPVSLSLVHASSLEITVHNSQIDLNAQEVPLIDLLRTISEKTKINIESRDPLAERITLILKGASIEQCIRRLMGNRNYVLTYKKTGDGPILPAAVQIFGTGSMTLIKPGIEDEPSAPPLEDPLKKIERKSFRQAFGDIEKLANQISAIPVTKGPEGSGFKLTKVPKNSFFSDIGLKTGDIVQDVNGQQVASAEEFIEALQAAIEDENMIRIARIKNNSLVEPIYIELH